MSDIISFTDNTVFLTIELKNKQNKNITISCIYGQPGSDIMILALTIKELFKGKRIDIYKCVDFNINLLNHKDNNDIKHFTDMLFSFRFFPVIYRPSGISTQTTTVIDNMFTNMCNVSHEGGLL